MDAIKEYFRIADKFEHEEITLQEYEEQCQTLRDVKEIVHGEWIKGVCDKCGFDWEKVAPIAGVPNYCPNCGAKMDL